jgi:hypothetical protein
MGDIIWGTFIIILALGAFGLYRLSTRKNVEQRSFVKFISLLIILGGLIGFLTTAFNKRLLDGYAERYFLTLIFFFLQTLASILYFRQVKVGLPLLTLTLLLQVPIVRGLSFSYRNQTLFGVILQNSPGNFWDIEPGSYVRVFHFKVDNVAVERSPNNESSFGINLIPLLNIIAFLRSKKRSCK